MSLIAMKPDAGISPGKARLLTGIACVGSLVTVASVLLFTDSLAAFLPASPAGPIAELSALAAFFASAAAVMIPFDLAGGLLIPLTVEKHDVQWRQRIMRWGRSVTLLIGFCTVTCFFYLQVGRSLGPGWLIAFFALVQLTLLAGQELFWRFVTGNFSARAVLRNAVAVSHLDPRFTGGVTGVPGCEVILIPDRWLQQIGRDALKVTIRRRRTAVRTGSRSRGLLLASVWNILLFAAAMGLHGWSVRSVYDLAAVYLWFLLLSFIGLLLLPSLNRRAVLAIDQAALGEVSEHLLADAIREIDDLTEADPTRSPKAESVFQPIPCVARRLRMLSAGRITGRTFWNVARSCLFLSWAFGGPLARAVHCNVGRPELWALPPTD